KDSIQPLRPWRAYYSIVRSFWSKRPVTHNQVDVDAVLGSMARVAGKRVGYEFPSGAFTTFMALMSDKAQSQYIEWLLDFLDDYKKGRNEPTESFSWIDGDPGDGPTRSLDRMRTKMPDLYQVMQPQRNGWWARKVFELLGTKGTHFVAIGQLHVLGPDGLPRLLERLGVALELVQ
ncbi:MAG: TraB/GumN family protein, partial [Gemmatimonadota bacterium]